MSNKTAKKWTFRRLPAREPIQLFTVGDLRLSSNRVVGYQTRANARKGRSKGLKTSWSQHPRGLVAKVCYQAGANTRKG